MLLCKCSLDFSINFIILQELFIGNSLLLLFFCLSWEADAFIGGGGELGVGGSWVFWDLNQFLVLNHKVF